MERYRSVLGSIFLSLTALTIQAQQSASQKVDSLFAAWSTSVTPGCALAIIKDGEIIYRRAYGMADIERDAPNRPSTIFHIASMSKQFTAFAIHLLAEEGKISLDDDVRKYLPELHDFGKKITIRNLLYHTSGLRDQWILLALSGWRMEDVITEEDILNLVWRQKELNFPPGEEFLYSNTGYTLLGVIVKRVSGVSLPEFTQKRIFAPLGMQHTHFHDEYGALVKGRASSYSRQPQGDYKYIALSYSNVGATSLLSTVEDLARWDQNFYDGRIGGKALLADMQTTGKLNDGKELNYASGLGIGEYRGLKIVEHSGGDAGYRSDILRFPEQHFSVIILANTAEMDPSLLALKIADIYLGDKLKPVPPSPNQQRVEVNIDPKLLDAYVGAYEIRPGVVLTITKEKNQLTGQITEQQKYPLLASSETEFFIRGIDGWLSFERSEGRDQATKLVWHQNGPDVLATRIKNVSLTDTASSKYVGTFYSDELGELYTVSLGDGGLSLHYPRGDLKLTLTYSDTFSAPFPINRLRYSCDDSDFCDSFSVGDGRVRNLRFEKVEIMPVVHK